eukprot:681001-Rhodomonas_salina.4
MLERFGAVRGGAGQHVCVTAESVLRCRQWDWNGMQRPDVRGWGGFFTGGTASRQRVEAEGLLSWDHGAG